MTKIERKFQKVFAGQAGSQQVTAFGTAKNDTPTFTRNLDEIQNNNFLYGWQPALLPDKSPWEEDMNALFYAVTKQLAYLFQEGVPEYDPQTEYSLNSLARGVGSNVIYCSLTDNNTGHDLSDLNYWTVYITGGTIANYEIGKPNITLNNSLLPNEIWLEGQAVSRTTYASLFSIYGTTYGAGDGSTTFNLPDFRNRAIWGADGFGYLNAGLPNITGRIGNTDVTGSSSTGCFYRSGTSGKLENSGGRPDPDVYIDASLSSPIYGRSNTVQPPAIKVRVKTRWY